MAEVVLSNLLQRQIKNLTLGLEFPERQTTDTVSGAGRQVRLRGTPRFGGQFTFEMAETRSTLLQQVPAPAQIDPAEIELFLNEVSLGAPKWFKLPIRAGQGALQTVYESEVVADDDPDYSTQFTVVRVTGAPSDVAVGGYVLVSESQALGDTGRLHQIASFAASTSPQTGSVIGLHPNIPYTGTQYLHPAPYVRAYIPDGNSIYTQRRGKAKTGKAIHGPWTVTWSEQIGEAAVVAAAGEPAVLSGPGISVENDGTRLGTARTVQEIDFSTNLTATRTGDKVTVSGAAGGGGGGSLQAATKNEAEAGTGTALRSWSPLRIAEAIAALAPAQRTFAAIATGLNALTGAARVSWSSLKDTPAVVTQSEAEGGSITTVRQWTPQRVSQAIAALARSSTSIAWTAVTGKPATATRWPTYDEVTGTKPPTDAEANVNADWSATSGDAQILNKPAAGTAAEIEAGTVTDIRSWSPLAIHEGIMDTAGELPLVTLQEIQDGAGSSFATSASTTRSFTGQIDFTGIADFDLGEYNNGDFHLEIDFSFSARGDTGISFVSQGAAAAPDNTLTLTSEALIPASTVLISAVYAPATAAGGFEVRNIRRNVYRQTSRLGNIRFVMARDSSNILHYALVWFPRAAERTAYTFTVETNIRLVYVPRGGAAPAAVTYTRVAFLPSVTGFARGTLANVVGLGAVSQWMVGGLNRWQMVSGRYPIATIASLQGAAAGTYYDTGVDLGAPGSTIFDPFDWISWQASFETPAVVISAAAWKTLPVRVANNPTPDFGFGGVRLVARIFIDPPPAGGADATFYDQQFDFARTAANDLLVKFGRVGVGQEIATMSFSGVPG